MEYIYTISDEREAKIWQEAIFIFDSSALLDFYFLPLKEREKIFLDLFTKKLNGRLYLPNHVKAEYDKNKVKVIDKPIIENYRPLKDEILKDIRIAINRIETKTNDLKNRTKKNNKHPHLPQNHIESYLETVKLFKDLFEDFESKIDVQIEDAENEINSLKMSDDVEKAVNIHFQIGRYYKYSEIFNIITEGKQRYEYLIPPGYEDLKSKKGTQIFGDLIIWKQVLELAKIKSKSVIFICNDLKEDWYESFKKGNNTPREELIKEMFDYANVEFWMYTLSDFLEKSNKYFNVEIDKENLNELFELINSKNIKEEELLIIKCNKCGRINKYNQDIFYYDFEWVGSDERQMGNEDEYHSCEYENCQYCNKQFDITFKIWEYPSGVHNHDEIEIIGGELIQPIEFTMEFYADSQNICGKCGKKFDDFQNINICSKCEKEYE